ncbi:MAG: cysteine desulfurase [Candidatus Melainabacteria bacterium]|nr:cysteine desulfurase [Candidatus Melainabacteria bacterium]
MPHASTPPSCATTLKPEVLRKDFPILSQSALGDRLVYLDNAATTHKPEQVIERMSQFYRQEYGTVRRGVYGLSVGATARYDEARQTVAQFLNAPEANHVVFTKGTTEAINLVARCYGGKFVQPGDEILITAMEHHANLVPWQQLCFEKSATLRILPLAEDGTLTLDTLPELLNERTKLVAVTHVSNALGTVNPVEEIIRQAHAWDIPVLVDGAQSAPHMAVDVQRLDCDFYCFSGHKLYGPTGVGVLYAKPRWQEAMNPYQYGGDMVDKVRFEQTTFADIPHKFEAGTPPIAEVIGLAEAIRYISALGLEAIAAHEHQLLQVATERMSALPGLRIIGAAPQKAALISFLMGDAHPLDIGTILDHEGIAIRTGHHCAQPVMQRYGVTATARVSFGVYNTLEDVDRFILALQKVQKLFQ